MNEKNACFCVFCVCVLPRSAAAAACCWYYYNIYICMYVCIHHALYHYTHMNTHTHINQQQHSFIHTTKCTHRLHICTYACMYVCPTTTLFIDRYHSPQKSQSFAFFFHVTNDFTERKRDRDEKNQYSSISCSSIWSNSIR
jgi:hypothetical protein